MLPDRFNPRVADATQGVGYGTSSGDVVTSPASPPSGESCLTGPDAASRQFDPELRSVGAARRFAADTVTRWGVSPHDLDLVVGELAANAVVHGHTPFTVSLCLRDRTVSIEVCDEDAGPVQRSAVSSEAQSGRGLVIVDRVATNWGIRPRSEGGKVVWAEIDG